MGDEKEFREEKKNNNTLKIANCLHKRITAESNILFICACNIVMSEAIPESAAQ